MRTVELTDADFEENDRGWAGVRWKTQAHDVLEILDHQLKEHGLQIEMGDTGSTDPMFRVVEYSETSEIEHIQKKLNTALKSTDYGWGSPLGELVGGELSDMLKDGRADDNIEWLRAAEAKFDQYRRCL